MNVFIYARVSPNNQRVAPSDRLHAQHQRCREFASKNGLIVLRTYSDQGEMRMPRLLPEILRMLERLSREEQETLVLADHPGRLGVQDSIRKAVIAYIEKAGGSFTSVYFHSAKSKA